MITKCIKCEKLDRIYAKGLCSSCYSKGHHYYIKVTKHRKRRHFKGWRKTRIIISCPVCKKEIIKTFSFKQVHCSKLCSCISSSRRFVGKGNPHYGQPNKPYHRCKGGYRKDLNCYFRSAWEVNIARILNYLKIKWKYENKRFYFDDCTYLPDFKINNNLYIEVKGVWDEPSIKKVNRFQEYYPEKEVIIVDGEMYKQLKQQFGDKIEWEN